MKEYRNLYIAYDIQDDNIRNLLANILLCYGLHRVQYSVFEGVISLKDKKDMIRDIERLGIGNEDKIHIIDLCENCLRNIITIGKESESKEHLIL